MAKTLSFAVLIAALLLAGCGRGGDGADWQGTDVRPDQFALLPCGETRQHPCALVVAGGKRLLFGAPAGVVQSMRSEDLRYLDAVMVFSLAANDLEGLDEVRNASWHAGRSEPLRVIGPNGLDEVVTALNKAYEQADALYVVRNGIPPGGYDAAIITATTASSGQTVFDTGDLKVARTASGYLIDYAETSRVRLQACDENGNREMAAEAPLADFSIGCDARTSDIVWPVAEPVFVSKK